MFLKATCRVPSAHASNFTGALNVFLSPLAPGDEASFSELKNSSSKLTFFLSGRIGDEMEQRGIEFGSVELACIFASARASLMMSPDNFTALNFFHFPLSMLISANDLSVLKNISPSGRSA